MASSTSSDDVKKGKDNIRSLFSSAISIMTEDIDGCSVGQRITEYIIDSLLKMDDDTIVALYEESFYGLRKDAEISVSNVKAFIGDEMLFWFMPSVLRFISEIPDNRTNLIKLLVDNFPDNISGWQDYYRMQKHQIDFLSSLPSLSSNK